MHMHTSCITCSNTCAILSPSSADAAGVIFLLLILDIFYIVRKRLHGTEWGILIFSLESDFEKIFVLIRQNVTTKLTVRAPGVIP
mmetsp:Transcript_16030/g.28780  ORF Transcript_16030/g.28780 Transcript_16030/m.28780 type:complete len:85 (-) Transcript_16030:1191-1445(-)